MNPSDPPDTLLGDLLAVIRRHDPAWTNVNDSDPGVTLLEIGGWIAERLGTRSDPYRDFNFRVKLDGAVVAGVTRISALRRTVDVVEHRDGGAPDVIRRLPGRRMSHPFTLERALGADTAFEDWSDLLNGPTPAAGWRKEVRIEILDQAGRLFLAYDVHGCWPAGYRVLPDLRESLTLVPEGWQRDRGVR